VENRIIEKITTEYGTPIYIVDERILENSANEFEVAFNNISHPVHIAYPYKANFLQRICLYMLNRDYWSEVSSETELVAAMSICDEPRS
jgi:diaminopimelate decarboxylase